MTLYQFSLLPALLIVLVFYWKILETGMGRQLLLSAFSLSVLATLHPLFPLSILGIVFTVHLGVKASSHLGRWTSLSVAAALFCLAWGKYGAVLAKTLDWGWTEKFVILPLGLSYFVFKWIQYVLDCYRGSVKPEERCFWRLLNYLSFFPTLAAGPLETYQGFYAKQLQKFDAALFHLGVRRTLWGFFKKLVVLELIFSAVFGPKIEFIAEQGATGFKAIAFSALLLVRAYLDLSAYTDIAIGLSALFGFRILENFKAPFLAKNISEFWQRWHISLSQWCRNNIYFPLFGLTRKPWIAAQASMLVMGLWHHASFAWLSWGLFHGTGLSLWSLWSRYTRKSPHLQKLMAHSFMQPVSVALTLAFVTVGFSLVAFEDFSKSKQLFLACLKALSFV